MNPHDQAAIHRALSNPDRIAIMDYLALLAKPQASVSEIAIAIKNAPTNAVKHLAKLEKVGLITRRRDNQTVWNSIAPSIVWPLVIRR